MWVDTILFSTLRKITISGFDWPRIIQLGNLSDFVCRYRVHENQISSSSILSQSFTIMCIQAGFHGASQETIRQSVQAQEKDFPEFSTAWISK